MINMDKTTGTWTI